MPAAYAQPIREAMARLGRIGAYPPEIVEAWMRLVHGTLDHLGPREFDREVAKALDAADVSSRDENEKLAESYGLMPLRLLGSET